MSSSQTIYYDEQKKYVELIIDFKHFFMKEPRVYQPSYPLQPYVKNIVMLDFDFDEGQSFTTRAVPRGVPVMLIPYRQGVCMQTDINTCPQPIQPVLIGQTTRTVTATLSGKGGLMYVVFQPTGLHPLIRHNMFEFTDNWEFPLENIPWIRREVSLFERLEAALSDKERLAIIEKVLLDRLLQVPIRQHIDSAVVDYIIQKNGNLCVVEASRYFQTSLRTLERHFKHHVGISPKQYADIVRFKHIMWYLKSHPNASLLDLTFLGGFSDQSHFIKNVRKITDNSPETYFSFDRALEDTILGFT